MNRATAATLVLRWRDDPVRFCDEVLGLRLWRVQAEVARDLVSHPKVAVKSGHKVGKSTLGAGIAHWWLQTRPRAKVVLGAPSGHQIRDIIWPEFLRLYDKARLPLGPSRGMRGAPSPDPFRGWDLPGARRIFGLSPDTLEAAAGISGANLLFIVDEASGFDMWEALEGNRAGGGAVLALGNPTQTSGEFYEAFHTKRQFWRTHTVSSAETPNVLEGRRVIPGLAERGWVEEKLLEWGEESDTYQVRVAGNFPGQARNAVISLTLTEAAVKRQVDGQGHLNFGVDVARFGDDDSVITARRGFQILRMRALSGNDTVQVAHAVGALARELRRPGEIAKVKVDVIGVGGGVADILRTLRDAGLPLLEVVDVNVAENATSTQEPGYHRLRDQLCFAVRDWLREGGAIPNDPILIGELVAPTYSFDPQGRYAVESKDRVKQRLKRSPDRADSLALAIYDDSPTDTRVLRVRSQRV